MAQHTSDESVLGKIETLVHEEQHLYGQEALSDTIRCASKRFRSSSINVGICCASGAPAASSARIRTARRSVQHQWSSATSSSA
jgi:hypothetical protein